MKTIVARRVIAALLTGALAACGSGPAGGPAPVESRSPGPLAAASAAATPLLRPRARWVPVDWAELPGWQADRTQELWPALQRGCDKPMPGWEAVCSAARSTSPANDADARAWLQQRLQPYRVEALDGAIDGLITGYFEPLVEARRLPRPGFLVPLHALPADLSTRKPYWTRQQLDTLPAARASLRGRELAWVADPLDALILQIQGSGPVKLMVVECTSDQTMRATAKWDKDAELPGSFRELVGDGRFVITIAPTDLAQTYQGVVELSGDSVCAVLEHYMSTSEQLETRLWLASSAEQATGMLLQRVPDSRQDEEGWNRAVILGETVRREELLQLPGRELLRRLFHEEDVRLFEPRIVSFRCSCSRDRVVNMLRMLGREEVQSILQERGAVEVGCEFCNRQYAFDPVDAEQIFASDVVTPPTSTRH